MSIYEKLLKVQSELKAPKNQKNTFGGYSYRSCEDILEALKPLLKENELALTLSDEIEEKSTRYYIKATAKLIDIKDGTEIINTAYAREEESKKGMDGSQITGASSSYARKYALNGLFAIDDTRDSDATNTGEKAPEKLIKESQIKELKELGFDDSRLLKMTKYYKHTKLEEVTEKEAQETINKAKKQKEQEAK